jgi:hypothetical protein
VILILTEPRDRHADLVADELRARGAPFLRFDPADFPCRAAISISNREGGRFVRTLRTAGTELDLASVRATWYRRPGTPLPDERLKDPAARGYVQLECDMLIQDLCSSLEGTLLPGHPLAIHRADQKTTQLDIAGRLGFELPPTLVTNRPADLLDFYRQHGGKIISKHPATAFPSTIGFDMVRYTELVTARDIAHHRDLAGCPMTFQAYVEKRVELRITVVGKRVFAAEIHSQANRHTRFDWRRYDLQRTPHLPHALPPEIERRCVALVERLGLAYGAIDMIVTPDGRYVFIEINPNGQYLWIEQKTELPITAAICDLLMEAEGAGGHP